MKTRDQSKRHLQLLPLLEQSNDGMTVVELSKKTGVAVKTARRDLKALERAGVGLIRHRRSSTTPCRYRIDGSRLVGEFTIRWDEAFALWAVKRHLHALDGTPFEKAARSLFERLQTRFDAAASGFSDRLGEHSHQIVRPTAGRRRSSDALDVLLQAVEERREAIIRYRDGDKARTIHPLGVVQGAFGQFYFIAFEPSKGIRTFKLDRILDAELTDARFEPPRGFNIAAYIRDSFGVFGSAGEPQTVVVRFSPAAAAYVNEGLFHESQINEPQTDGSMIARFELSSFEEFSRFVLSFGKEAELLEPPELRKRIAEEAVETASKYHNPLHQRRTRR